MEIDIAHLTSSELHDLRKQIDKRLVQIDAEARKAALAAAKAAAAEHGQSLDALLGKKPAAPKNPPKYRNPENPDETWSGRGRQPNWFKRHPVEEMAI